MDPATLKLLLTIGDIATAGLTLAAEHQRHANANPEALVFAKSVRARIEAGESAESIQADADRALAGVMRAVDESAARL